MDAREAAVALGGEVGGRQQVICPGPGHSRKDRSLSVRFTGDGFVVHSFAGDDPIECRDYVRERLGLEPFGQRSTGSRVNHLPAVSHAGQPSSEDDDRRQTGYARSVWNAARDPRGTLVEKYLVETRRLELPDTRVIRFHPKLKIQGSDLVAPAMVCAYTDIRTNEFRGVHRIWLSIPDAKKIKSATLGPTRGTAVKLDPDSAVTAGLGIAEGPETAIAARYIYRPVWCLISAVGIAKFPVLPGIEHLEIFTDHDANGTGERAANECRERWEHSGWEVGITMPPQEGTDIADFIANKKVY